MSNKTQNKRSFLHWISVLILIAFTAALIDIFTNIYLNNYKGEIMFFYGWIGSLIYVELFLKTK